MRQGSMVPIHHTKLGAARDIAIPTPKLWVCQGIKCIVPISSLQKGLGTFQEMDEAVLDAVSRIEAELQRHMAAVRTQHAVREVELV